VRQAWATLLNALSDVAKESGSDVARDLVKNQRTAAEGEIRADVIGVGLFFALAAGVVGVVAFLVWDGKLTSETGAVLFGVAVPGVLALLREGPWWNQPHKR